MPNVAVKTWNLSYEIISFKLNRTFKEQVKSCFLEREYDLFAG
jgi:hypothetical protein